MPPSLACVYLRMEGGAGTGRKYDDEYNRLIYFAPWRKYGDWCNRLIYFAPWRKYGDEYNRLIYFAP